MHWPTLVSLHRVPLPAGCLLCPSPHSQRSGPRCWWSPWAVGSSLSLHPGIAPRGTGHRPPLLSCTLKEKKGRKAHLMSWTQWSLCVPSNLGHCMTLWSYHTVRQPGKKPFMWTPEMLQLRERPSSSYNQRQCKSSNAPVGPPKRTSSRLACREPGTPHAFRSAMYSSC